MYYRQPVGAGQYIIAFFFRHFTNARPDNVTAGGYRIRGSRRSIRVLPQQPYRAQEGGTG